MSTLKKLKVNRKRVKLIERMAYKYRHSKTNRVETRHTLQISKEKHPSQTRQDDRENASMETRNDRQLGV